MTKKTVQSSAVEEFKGYIKVTDGFYLKPVESHASSYDVYQLKKSDSPRHPNGKWTIWLMVVRSREHYS